jgi:competence protein ComFC
MWVTLQEKIDGAKKFLKDVLFPLFCIDCGIEGTILCNNCRTKIPGLGIFCCPVCKISSENGVVCEKCHDDSFLDSMISVSIYQEHSVWARLLHELKYNGIVETDQAFQKIFASFFDQHADVFSEIESIVCVPLHPRRFAKRGFNQSEIFAQIISRELGLPVLGALRRIEFTRPQVGLSFEERQKNMVSAFVSTTEVSRKKILLVDDVYTTGSTMQECAKILKKSGAAEVHGFTFARAVDEF